MPSRKINNISWDTLVLNMPCYEISIPSYDFFCEIENIPGHYTIKVHPLDKTVKALLHKFKFYYCDTLLEPYVDAKNFKFFNRDDITLSITNDIHEIEKMLTNYFHFDRFHRNFNINSDLADLRYKNWANQLMQNHTVYHFLYKNEIIGFVACQDNKLQLHALLKIYQGKDLAKFCWTLVCNKLFSEGYLEITSSISASNLAILNLYTKLGFRFRNAADVYHRLIE